MKDFKSLTVISVEYYCLVNMLENDYSFFQLLTSVYQYLKYFF